MPVRDPTIGGASGISLVIGNSLAPRVMDWVSARVGYAKNPGDARQRDNLYEPREELSGNSSLHPYTRKTRMALEAQLRPRVALAAAFAVFGAIVAASKHGSRRDRR